MTFPHRLTATFFGVAATVTLIQAHPAVAAPTLTSAQVNEIARQVTVKIDGQAPGSGVIVARQGQTYFVLTAAHVVETEDEYEVIAPDGKKYPLDFKLVRKFPNVDLALVQFNSPQNYRVATIGDSTQLNDSPAYIAGFPHNRGGTIGTTYSFTEGQILAQGTRPVGKGYTLAYLNDTFTGMSGGPILNQQGQLIGIHGASKTRFSESQGISPLSGAKVGLNLGIPIASFLRSVNQVMPTLNFLAPPPPSSSSQVTAADLLIQAAEQSIANKSKEALALTEKAIEIQPNYAAAYFVRGGLRGLGDNADKPGAIVDFTQAIRLNPNFVEAYNNRGAIRSDLKDYKAAIMDFDQAIRINPYHIRAYYNRGIAHADLKDYTAAIADYTQAIRLNPNLASAYYNRGIAHANLKDYTAAIADYTQTIRLNPNDTKAYFHRGTIRAGLRDYTGAIADYDKAIQLNPNIAEAYNNRGIIRAELKDFAGAIEDYSQAIRINPNVAEAYYNRGNMRADLKDYTAAIADYNKAIQLNPNYAAAYLNRGAARTSRGDKLGAITDMQKAAALAQSQGNREIYGAAMQNLQILRQLP